MTNFKINLHLYENLLFKGKNKQKQFSIGQQKKLLVQKLPKIDPKRYFISKFLVYSIFFCNFAR